MAISAKFVADFGSFYAAVEKAEAQLIDLSARAGGAEKALNRMVDNFSGRRLVQDAHLMAEAVERIGGVGRLTQQELQRVGAQAQEAAAKLQAMGKEVPAGIQKIVDQTKNLNTQQGALAGTLRSVAGAFGLVFSVQTITRFFGEVVKTAGAVADMAEKLGVSAEAAQRFTFAARQTGASMESVERAIFTMNKALAGGSNSTLAALDALGLEFAAIRAKSPEEAFKDIAEAIRKIPDPMEQARFAAELFGRSSLDLLPAIKSGFVEVGEAAPVMSDRAIKAIDALGDAWDRAKTRIVATSGEILAAILNPVQAHEDAAQRMARASGELPPIIPQKELDRLKQAPAALRNVTISVEEEARAIRLSNEEMKRRQDAAEKVAKAQQAWNQQLRDFKNFIGIREMEDYAKAQEAAARQIEENVKLEFAMNKFYRDNAAALGDYAGNVGEFTKQWVGFGQLAPGIIKNITNSGAALKGGLMNFLKGGIADLFGGASSFGQGISNILKGIGTGIFESIGGGITGLISSGIGLAGKGIAKLFGFGPSEKKQVDEMRQAFIDQIGGWHELNKAANNTGLTLQRVLNAKTVKDYEAAIKELNDAIAFQDLAMQTLDETVKKYGFTLEELGPKFQAQQLDKKAQELFKDFQVLTGAGIEVEVVLGRMGEELNDFVQQSISMGVAVPKAMEPIIRKMIEFGILTDASGNVITSLEESGIQFAMTMSEGFEALIQEVKKLTEAIARGLGLALDDVERQVDNFPPLDVDVRFNVPELPRFPDQNIPGFARGTGGKYLDFGSGTLAMLHGRERVMTEGEGDGAGDFSGLASEIQGLRADMLRQQRLLPKQLRDAMILAA